MPDPDPARPSRARGVRIRGVPGRRPSPRRGVPVSPHKRTDALGRAHAQVGRYRGLRSTGRGAVEFTQAAVRDVLGQARQPVTPAWVSYTTSVVGRLAASCEAQGVQLTRDAVFARSRIDRFLAQDCARLAAGTRAGYRSRLDAVAQVLLNGGNDAPWPRASISALDVVVPYTYEQTGQMTAWARALRPYPRRERVQAVIALGLGAGLRPRDMLDVAGHSVLRDEHGVHLPLSGPAGQGPPRTVTVTATWEDAVWEHAQASGPNLLVARNRGAVQAETLSATLLVASRGAAVPVTIRRLRNTWLARHLAAGTPLPLLMQQAGLTTLAHFEDLLQVPNVMTIADPGYGPARAASWMRSARA